MTIRRYDFECWPLGRQLDSIWVRAANARDARNLAAFRLRIPRHLVSVRKEQPDARGFYFVTL